MYQSLNALLPYRIGCWIGGISSRSFYKWTKYISNGLNFSMLLVSLIFLPAIDLVLRKNILFVIWSKTKHSRCRFVFFQKSEHHRKRWFSLMVVQSWQFTTFYCMRKGILLTFFFKRFKFFFYYKLDEI